MVLFTLKTTEQLIVYFALCTNAWHCVATIIDMDKLASWKLVIDLASSHAIFASSYRTVLVRM